MALGPSMSGSSAIGIQNAAGFVRRSPKKAGGAIPTTVNGWPFIVNAPPTTDWIGTELLLPGAIADDRDRRCAFAIVVRREDAPRIRADAKHGKVISGDELAPHGLSRLAAAGAAHTDQIVSRLKGGEFDEAGRVIAEGFVFVVREKRPIVLETASDAAILHVTHTIEFAGFGDRQGIQQDGMDERENGSGRANSEGESQNGGRGENGGVGELSQRVANVFHEAWLLLFFHTNAAHDLFSGFSPWVVALGLDLPAVSCQLPFIRHYVQCQTCLDLIPDSAFLVFPSKREVMAPRNDRLRVSEAKNRRAKEST